MSQSLPAQRGFPPILVLLTASVGCAMTVLDSNIVAVVLPTIARDFGASFADVEWVISTYVLCFAALLLPAGAIADRFGRRRVFLCGIAGFAFASLLCGWAPSAPALYLARALQGVGAAFLLAPALAVIAHTFHGEAERNHAWAIWGGMMGLTMVIAPVAGGLITHALGWRWAFYINMPICALLAAATTVFVKESRDEDARGLDPAGIALFATTMFGVTWGLIQGQAQGWNSVKALAGFGVGLVALLAFVRVERTHPRPMLDLALFGERRLVGAVWAMFAYAACAQVMTSLLPPFLQNGFGLSPLQAGFAMLPFALAMLVFPHVGRTIGRRHPPATMLMAGLLTVGAGNALTALGAWMTAWPLVLGGMLVLGSGGGLLNGETQKAVMSVVPRARAGMASGISTTARFSGILLGFATLSGVLATVTRAALHGRASARALADAVVAGNLPHAEEAGIAAARTAYLGGFATALALAAVLAWVSAVAVWRLVRAG